MRRSATSASCCPSAACTAPDTRRAAAVSRQRLENIGLFLIGLIVGPQASPPGVVGRTVANGGRVLAGLAALAALVSFGPQKYLDAQFAMIWPAVLSGQAAVLAILLGLLPHRAAATATGPGRE